MTPYLTRPRVDIEQTGWSMLYSAANVEHYPHRGVDISATVAEILGLEYLSLNIQNCNYAGSGWVQILHSVNRMMSKLHYMLEKGAITTYKKDKVDC